MSWKTSNVWDFSLYSSRQKKFYVPYSNNNRSTVWISQFFQAFCILGMQHVKNGLCRASVLLPFSWCIIFSEIERRATEFWEDTKAPTIAKLLVEDECKASGVGIAKFLEKYRETGCIGRRIGSGHPSKIMAEIKAVVDRQMKLDDETSAMQLHAMLTNKHDVTSLFVLSLDVAPP